MELAAVEIRVARAVDLGIGSDDPFFEPGERHGHLERGSRRVAALNRAILQRLVFVGVERRPRLAIDAAGKIIRVERGTAGESQDFSVARIEHHRGARVGDAAGIGGLERVFDRLLHVEVDRQLQPLAFGRRLFFERANFASHAVDDHAARAVLADEIRVVDALDARLSGQVAALQRAVFRHLRVADFADIAKQVRAERLRITSLRHLLDDDVGELGVETPRDDGRDLRERRVLDNRDGPVRRFAAMTLDDRAHAGFLEAEDGRENADGPRQIFRVLAHNRDAVRVAVLHHHAPVAIEHEAARRPQRKRALVVVLRHFVVLLVLHDLEHPEAHGQNGKHGRDNDLQAAETKAGFPAIFDHGTR